VDEADAARAIRGRDVADRGGVRVAGDTTPLTTSSASRLVRALAASGEGMLGVACGRGTRGPLSASSARAEAAELLDYEVPESNRGAYLAPGTTTSTTIAISG